MRLAMQRYPFGSHTCGKIAAFADQVQLWFDTATISVALSKGKKHFLSSRPPAIANPLSASENIMDIQPTPRCILKGHSFAIEHHAAIEDWAARNHYSVVVKVDYGTDEEDYEEVVEFRFGSRCLFLMWRNAECVVVQPIVGRSRHHDSVLEALNTCHPPTARGRHAAGATTSAFKPELGAIRRTPA